MRLAWLPFIALGAAAFVAAHPLLLKAQQSVLTSPYPRAPDSRRFYAGVIDLVLSLTIASYSISLNSPLPLFIAAAYVLLRDGCLGRSVGKVLLSLMVIQVRDSQPAGLVSSVLRNMMFVIPGVNLSALVLEPITIARDLQGQRLGDHLAGTQVVMGYGARELAESLFPSAVDQPGPSPRDLPYLPDIEQALI